MSIDYGEKEREFLDSLAADTGRDLATWMAAITATGLTGRNEIIDWLRHQGFMFSKASWLERIFNNGGKPIYGPRSNASKGPSVRAPARPRPQAPAEPRETAPAPGPAPAPIAPPVAPAPATAPVPLARRPDPPLPAPQLMPPAAPTETPGDLEATLSKAKAFRPLASFLLTEIRKALPSATIEAYPAHVAIVLDGIEVAIVAISAKDIRLLIAALGQPFDAGLSPAKMPAGLVGARLSPTHMIALTDARAVTPPLIERVRLAALAARGKS